MMRDVTKFTPNMIHLSCGHTIMITENSTPSLYKDKLWCDVCNHVELGKSMQNISELGNPVKYAQFNPQETSIFTKLLNSMQVIHDKKKHDYTSNDDPYGNYRFAGKLSKLFDNPDDAGFVGRIGEKLYRLANLDNSGKTAINETIEDTEIDICTIVVLWMASRKERRIKGVNNGPHMETTGR